MADTQQQQQESRRKPRVGKIQVEFGDSNNRTITINCLREKVRGRFSISTLHARPEGGRDIGNAMSGMPDIPGLRMEIIASRKKAILFDPLENDEDRLARINAAARRARAIFKGRDITFVRAREIELNDDLLKTLLLELWRKQQEHQLTVLDGELPDPEEIAKLPGRELYDPWNNGRKPTYVEQVPEWHDKIDAQ